MSTNAQEHAMISPTDIFSPLRDSPTDPRMASTSP